MIPPDKPANEPCLMAFLESLQGVKSVRSLTREDRDKLDLSKESPLMRRLLIKERNLTIPDKKTLR